VNEGIGRLLVVVAAVLAGILLIAKGFEGSAAVVVPPAATKSPSSAPTSPSPSSTKTSTAPTGGGGVKAKRDGVVVAIYNATSTNGLAASAESDLTKKGYVVRPPGNFPSAPTTTIYYRDGAQGKADAGLLKQDLIPEAKIKPLPTNLSPQSQIPKDAELIVVLGNDYAASHPVPNG
jgi:hypothetical protein